MFCSYCGKEIADGAKFCRYCGKKQPEAASQPANTYAAPQPAAPQPQPTPQPQATPQPAAPQPSAYTYTNQAAPTPKQPAAYTYTAPATEQSPTYTYTAPAAPAPAQTQAYNYAAPAAAPPVKPRKKASAGKILLPIAIIILLLAGGAFGYIKISYGNTEKVLAKAAGYGQSQQAIKYLDKALLFNKDAALMTERDRIYFSQWKIGQRVYRDPDTGEEAYRNYLYDYDTGELTGIQYSTENGDYSYDISVDHPSPNHETWSWYYDGNISRYTDIFFDDKGQSVEYRYSDVDNDPDYTWYAIYNDHGDELAEVGYDADGTFLSAEFYSYEYSPDSRNKTVSIYSQDVTKPTVHKYKFNDGDGTSSCDVETNENDYNGMRIVHVEYEFYPLPEQAQPAASGDIHSESLRLLDAGEELQEGDIILCYVNVTDDEYDDSGYYTLPFQGEEAAEIFGGHKAGETYEKDIDDEHYKIEIRSVLRPLF